MILTRPDDGTSGRLYVMVLDDLHTPPLRTKQVRRAARLSSSSTSARTISRQSSLTSGRTDRIAGAHSETSNSCFMPSTVSPARSCGPLKIRSTPKRGFNARIAMSTLREVAGADGRPAWPPQSLALHQRRDRLRHLRCVQRQRCHDRPGRSEGGDPAATRSNVSIYSVDPRGLTSLADEEIERRQLLALRSGPGHLASAAPRAGQSANPLGHDRRLRRREFERLRGQLFERSSATTALTTCWASTRRMTSATAGSGSSLCARSTA